MLKKVQHKRIWAIAQLYCKKKNCIRIVLQEKGVVGLVCIARGEGCIARECMWMEKCIVIWWCSGLKLYCNKEVGC